MHRIYVSLRGDVLLRKHFCSAKLWKLKADFIPTFRHRPIDSTSCSSVYFTRWCHSNVRWFAVFCNSTKYAIYLRSKFPFQWFQVSQVANFASVFVIFFSFDVLFGCQMSSKSSLPSDNNPFEPTSSIHKICKVNATARKEWRKFWSVAHYREYRVLWET